MPLIGEIASLITAMLWSSSSIVFTEASRRIGSQQINVDRLIVASICLFITIMSAGWIQVVPGRQMWLLIISGLIGLIFGDGFLFKALHMIGARYGMLVMSLVPAISAILAFIILGETLSFTVILGMAITLTGILFVVLKGSADGNSKETVTKLGLFYAFLGALGQAAGLLFAKAAFSLGEINGFYAAFIRVFTTVLLFLPAMIMLKRYRNPFKLYQDDRRSLLLTIAGGMLGPYIGITFSLIAVKNTSVGIASTLMATVPVLMLPLLRVVYKEKITLRALVGALLAVSGVAILFLR